MDVSVNCHKCVKFEVCFVALELKHLFKRVDQVGDTIFKDSEEKGFKKFMNATLNNLAYCCAQYEPRMEEHI